jgi:cyclic-di-GMP-binding protein
MQPGVEYRQSTPRKWGASARVIEYPRVAFPCGLRIFTVRENWGADMADHSFDITASVDINEIDNAHQQALKEIGQRWDFKGKTAQVEWNKSDKAVTVTASDKMVLEALLDIFKTKLSKRGVNTKALELKTEEPASGGAIRQIYELVDGLPADRAKEITKMIKQNKFKVQASIQGDSIRVSGKSRDELQAVQQAVLEMELPLPIGFGNYK